MCVCVLFQITQDDIRKTYGGSSGSRGYYSRAFARSVVVRSLSLSLSLTLSLSLSRSLSLSLLLSVSLYRPSHLLH